LSLAQLIKNKKAIKNRRFKMLIKEVFWYIWR
jgi:hypothetical protein